GALADRLLQRDAGQDPLDRDLELLAGQGPGDLGDGLDAVGDVAGGQLGPDRGPDAAAQLVVQPGPRAQHHEQQQPPLAAGIAGVDDQAVGDLVQALDDPVELGRAHPDPAPVEGRVRAAADDAGATLADLDPVAVAPDPRPGREVAVAVAVAV